MNYKDFISSRERNCAIITHRGIWLDAPENTLSVIERAIAEDYDAVEIDIRQSADGELFVLHDAILRRMAGLDAAPEDLPSSELSAIRLRNRNGGTQNVVTSRTLPSLREVFEVTRGRILIHLDVKDRTLIPEVIAHAQEMGVDQEVDVWAELRHAGDLAWIYEHATSQNIAFIAKTRLNVADAAVQTELVLQLQPQICEIYFDYVGQVAALKDHFAEAGIAFGSTHWMMSPVPGSPTVLHWKHPTRSGASCVMPACPRSRPTKLPP